MSVACVGSEGLQFRTGRRSAEEFGCWSSGSSEVLELTKGFLLTQGRM